jgi:hypothetical protein
MLHEYYVIHSVRYYPWFQVTAVGLGTYYPWIRRAQLYISLHIKDPILCPPSAVSEGGQDDPGTGTWIQNSG